MATDLAVPVDCCAAFHQVHAFEHGVLAKPVLDCQGNTLQLAFLFLGSLLCFLIFVLFDFCVGMIAFFTSYIFGLFMVKEALMSFLTGQLIPLSFFPAVVQRIFDFLPFSSMIYTPVMIYLGKYQGTELAWVLLRQLAWVLILYGLGTLIWNRVTKRLVVLGG